MKSIRTAPHTCRQRCGFTLVELMVAMVITTIILGILVSVTRTAIDSWQYSRERVRAARQAKLVIDQMAKDFESMEVRSGNNHEWLYSGVDDDTGGGAVTGGDAAKLAFFTGATDRYNGQLGVGGVDKGGDVCGVAYRLAYKDPIQSGTGEQSVFALYRNIIDPDKTFEGLLAKSELVATGRGSGPFTPHLEEADGITNFIAENIYGLTLSFLVEYKELVRVGRGSVLVTKYRRISVIDTAGDGGADELRVKGSGIFVSGNSGDAGQRVDGRLVSVDIGITVITEFAMNRVREGGFSDDELAELIAKNSHRYARTVNLNHL